MLEQNQRDWGCFEITLDDYLKSRNISKNKLAIDANLQRTQLNAYCRSSIQRPDLQVLARICFALECDLSDIIKYVKPSKDDVTRGGV